MSSRDKKFLIIIGALVLALVAVVIIVVVSFTGENSEEGQNPQSGQIVITDNNQNSQNGEEGKKENNTPVNNPDILTEGTEVSTPCGIVFYPGEWEDHVEVENIKKDNGETIRFFAKIEGKEKIALFDLNFGIAEGNRLGSVKAGEKKIDLYCVVYESDFKGEWSEEEKNIVYSMQEGFNNITAQLEIDTSVSEAVDPSGNKVKIKTPYGTINFPGEWEEYLVTEVDSTGDYTVKFYAEIDGKKFGLFDFIFGAESDSSFGKVKADDGSEAWLNVTVHEFVPDDETESSTEDIVYGMQEAFNDIAEDLIG
ncbi:MAG: hypothetical protein IKL57_08330 [Oscillospiraceae bacterium]|nr:hypothetical protein [Oscillospiraceae bacterium]